MKKNITEQNIRDSRKDFYGKKVSSNELVIVDFLNNSNSFEESEHYIISDNCVYVKSKGAKIFLFYKEDDKIFYRFAENNKNITKKILPLIGDDFKLYFMHREIEYPKVRRNVLENVDKEDMLHSMIYIYLEDLYYDILYESGHDFLEILFRQIIDFEAEEEMFSEEMTENIQKWTKPKKHPDHEWSSYWKFDIPLIYIPNEYLEMAPENLKRAYKINSLIS